MRTKIQMICLLLYFTLALLAWGGMHPVFVKVEPFAVLALFVISLLSIRPKSELIFKPTHWVFALIAIAAIQILPFPQWLLQMIAPLSKHYSFEILNSLDIASNTYHPISLARYETARAGLAISQFLMVFLSFVICFQDPKVRKWSLRYFILCASLLALWGLSEIILNKALFGFPRKGFLSFGSFLNKNHASIFMALGASAALSLADFSFQMKKRSILWSSLSLLCFIGVLSTGSRTGLLLALCCTSYFAFIKKRSVYLFMGLSLLGLVLIFKAPTFQRLGAFGQSRFVEQRLEFWAFALRTFFKNPFFGVGIGAFDSLSTQIKQVGTWVHPEHVENDFLELLVCCGLAGLLAMVWFFKQNGTFILKSLKSKWVSPDSQSYAILTSGLLFSSLFVFAFPLPIFQISFAFFLSGLSTSKQHGNQVHSRTFLKLSLFALLCFFSFMYFQKLYAQKAETPMAPPNFVKRPSPAEEAAFVLLQEEYLNDLKAQLQAKPFDATNLYKLAAHFMTDHMTRAKQTYIWAKEIDPLDFKSQVLFLSRLSQFPAEHTFAYNEVDKMISHGPNFHPNTLRDLKIERALMEIGNKESSTKAFSYLNGSQTSDWKELLMLAHTSPLPSEQTLLSWKEFKKQNLPEHHWNLFFARLWSLTLSESKDLQLFLNSILQESSSSCDLLLLLSRHANIYSISLPVSKMSEAPFSIGRFSKKGHQFKLTATDSRAEIDAITLPFHYEFDQNSCLLRLGIYSSRSPKNQIVASIHQHLTKLNVSRISSSKSNWVLDIDTQQSFTEAIEAIGFTPLEDHSFFEIKTLDLLVNSRP